MMQIRALDNDVITIEADSGEMISVKQFEKAIKIKTKNSILMIQGGAVIEHIRNNKILIKRKGE